MQLETIELGVNTTIIGMGVVFSVLIILSFTTWLLTSIIDGNIERKKAQEAAAAAATAKATVKPVSELAPAAVPAAAFKNADLSPKTVATIMAAVSFASGQPLSKLRFTAIRRGNTSANAWAASSTADIITNRQAYL